VSGRRKEAPFLAADSMREGAGRYAREVVRAKDYKFMRGLPQPKNIGKEGRNRQQRHPPY
jgi:hypothetical protein